MNRKRLIITSTISIVLISILMISSTYSIFTTSEVGENTNVYTTGNLDVTYTLSEEDISFTKVKPLSNEEAENTIVPYRITVTNTGTVPYKFNIILNDTTASNTIDYQYINIRIGKLEPKLLSECENNIIKEDVIVPSGRSVNIDVRIWISNEIENIEIGKSFYAKLAIDGLAIYDDTVDIDNSILITYPLLSNVIKNNYHDGSTITTVNIGGDTSNPTVSLNATQGIMLDNNSEYRYYGTNPNNYVEFNDELWRIISVSNVKSSANDTTGDVRVKLIRNESIGNYSWDSSEETINDGNGVNDWSQADLMTELNDLYYNKKAGICCNGRNNASEPCSFTTIGLSNEAKNKIDNSLWYLGSSSNGLPFVAYNSERGTTVYPGRPTNWKGIVGLMYPSDYGYATNFSICTNNMYNYNSNEGKNNNWLYYDLIDQWTLSPGSSNMSYAFDVYQTGTINTQTPTYYAKSVHPVIYLKPAVQIVSGIGTSDDPYQLL